MPITNSDNEDNEEGAIEVVDFNDVGTLFDTIGNTSKSTTTAHKGHWADSPKFTGASTRKVRTTSMDVNDLSNMVNTTTKETQNMQPKGHLPSNMIGPDPLDMGHFFYVDPKPTSVPIGMGSSSVQPPSVLNEVDDDDVIVYVAPNPRNSSTSSKKMQDRPSQIASSTADTPHKSRPSDTTSLSTTLSRLQTATPSTSTISQAVKPINLPSTPAIATTPSTTIPEPPPFSSVTLSFSKSSLGPDTTETALGNRGTSTPARLRVPPVTTLRQAKVWKQKVQRAGKRRHGAKKYRAASFGAFGAMREEALLRRIDKERDEKYDERRRGDSDLEWADTDGGDDDDERKVISEELEHDMPSVLSSLEKGKGKAEEQRDEGHGMDVDSDLDMSTMTSFVQGLLGPDAGKHLTMDDVRDQEIMKMEDEDQNRSSGSEDEEADGVLEAEEARFMDEIDDHDIGPKSTTDDEEDDKNSFEARLQRIRANAGAPKNADGLFEWSSDDDNEDDILEKYKTWACGDDDFVCHTSSSKNTP